MKKVKVSIQDENTLLLLEEAQKGDIIDLKSIHEADIDKSSIDNLIKSIKNDEFNKQLETAKQSIEEKKRLEAKFNEKDIIDQAKEALSKKDAEIVELKSKIRSFCNWSIRWGPDKPSGSLNGERYDYLYKMCLRSKGIEK